MNPNTLIRKKFRVKPRDSLPFTGWAGVTRNILPEIFVELGYAKGAEIGVAQGNFSRFLCESIPELKLYCIDSYTPYQRISQRVCDWRRVTAIKRLEAFDIEFMHMTSPEAAQQIEDGSLDFIYIDGDHRFDAVMLDLILWVPKVRKGGIISGHDYYHFYQAGVCLAVDTYTAAHGINQWYVTKEKECSFLWVKE